MTTIERALNSIGKQCFVENFNLFKNCTDKSSLANKLLLSNPNSHSLSAQITRVNYACWIFDNHLEKEALKIVLSSNRLSYDIQSKARLLLKELI